MSRSPRAFRYFTNPVCLGAIVIYALNRWFLKPHDIGGAFTHGYLNDILCLPLFLPMSLGIQRWMGLRHDDLPPRTWEIIQHGIVFSVIFEVILPRYPTYFRTTADPWDAVAYFVGGFLAAYLVWWRRSPTDSTAHGSVKLLPGKQTNVGVPERGVGYNTEQEFL